MERPVFWHEGLFLQPQHFQISESYMRSLITPLNRFIQPYLWGVGNTEIAVSALENLSFNLTKCDLILPDMTHVVFPGNALIEARSFDEAWLDGGQPFTVLIGLKKWNPGSENVTVREDLVNLADVHTRFVTAADPEQLPDMYQNAPAAEVSRLFYLLKIFWETEREYAGDHILLPLAKLVRTGDSIAASEQYAPPSLMLSASAPLMKIVTEIRDQISARGRQLESYKRERGIHTAEFGARDMVYLLALRTLNRYIPMLFHLTEVHLVHPWSVYGTLRQLVGELSAFSDQVSALGELSDGSLRVPPYDHRRLWECFSQLQALVSRLLDEITAGPEYVTQLIYDGAYHAAELSAMIFEGGNRYYLVMESEADPQTIVRSLSTAAKLSSRETLPLLIARALPGISLTHLPVPPQELPKRTHATYIQIDHHSDQWSQVQQSRNIALFWDAAPDDLKIELMVTGRS